MGTNEARNRFWFPGIIIFFRICVALEVVSLLLVLLLVLTGCAPKNQPVVIDKSQIDLTALMVQDLDSPSGRNYFNLLYPGDSPGRPGTNVMCHLLGWSAADGEKLIALSGRTVQFTDGSTPVATGRISGWVSGVVGPSNWGLTVTFESPETVKALARALATTR